MFLNHSQFIVEMKECVVLVDRLPFGQIQRSPKRCSKRLMLKKAGLQLSNILPAIPKANKTPKKNNAIGKTIRKNASKSVGKPLKSAIKVGGMRSRSKSVSFDPAIVTPVKSARRRLFGADQVAQTEKNDSTTGQADVASQHNAIITDEVDVHVHAQQIESIETDYIDVRNQDNELIASYVDVQAQQNDSFETDLVDVRNQHNGLVTSYVDVETEQNDGMFQAYETRLKNLVASNHTKVNRIKDLIAEKSNLLKEINTLHNMNRAMAETIDVFRADDNDENAAHYEERIGKLEDEIDSLRQRIDRANRDKFDLIAENEQMKICISTYSKNVLAEHNYNM